MSPLLALSGQSLRRNSLSAFGGDLNGSTQHFIFNGKDGVCGDQSKISSRLHCGRENGVVGALAAGGVAQSDWAGVWQAVIFHLLPSRTARGDSSCTTASLAVGVDTSSVVLATCFRRWIKYSLWTKRSMGASRRAHSPKLESLRLLYGAVQLKCDDLVRTASKTRSRHFARLCLGKGAA